MVEAAAEAKIQALREETRVDSAKLEALEKKAETKRNKRKERKRSLSLSQKTPHWARNLKDQTQDLQIRDLAQDKKLDPQNTPEASFSATC